MAREILRRLLGIKPSPPAGDTGLTTAQFEDAMQRTMLGESVLMNAHDEQRKAKYLSTLSEADRAHIIDFLSFAREMKGSLHPIRIAVIAVGSATRPESARHHPVLDIDLRILNSEEPESKARLQAVSAIREKVRGYLQRSCLDFQEDDCTVKNKFVRKSEGDLIEFVDWNNSDSSFKAKYGNGLPLHISVSGADNYALEKYLQLERKRKTSTVILV